MKILFYSTRSYDKISFRKLKEQYAKIEITFIESSLNEKTVELATNYDGICIFVNDNCSTNIVKRLAELNIKIICLRCAGFNNVDYKTANKLGIKVIRVPAYSPESIAEHAMTLALSVNRRIHKAYTRVRDNNFSLTGLSGFCLNGKTAGIVGYGRIGKCLANICKGFGMHVVAYDPYFTKVNENDKTEEVDLNSLYSKSDFIFLTTILNESTHHMINKSSISKMKKDVILVNVSRGALIDTEDLIDAIKSGKFFGVGLDVYEGEDENVYTNHEDDILMNCITSRLLSFPNVIITSHQAFLTDIALNEIAQTTCKNLYLFINNNQLDERCEVK